MKSCNVSFLVQPEPKGVADAISLARNFVGNDPFGCIMPDCLLFSEEPFLSQLMDSFSKHHKNIIGTVNVNRTEAKRYGNVGLLETNPLDDTCFFIQSLSVKSGTPLDLSKGQSIKKGFGGGIYLPEYFGFIDMLRPDSSGEIDDVPIHHMLIRENNLLGVTLKGAAFDTGHPAGYRAAVRYAGRPGVSGQRKTNSYQRTEKPFVTQSSIAERTG
jgi:UTP--glucose-1-phosphate uridylyltransferase